MAIEYSKDESATEHDTLGSQTIIGAHACVATSEWKKYSAFQDSRREQSEA